MEVNFRQYVRNDDNQKLGIFLVNYNSTSSYATVTIGWSLCRGNELRKYDPDFGINTVAQGRLNSGRYRLCITAVGGIDDQSVIKLRRRLPRVPELQSTFDKVLDRLQRIARKDLS